MAKKLGEEQRVEKVDLEDGGVLEEMERLKAEGHDAFEDDSELKGGE